jgi:hypothetical protein
VATYLLLRSAMAVPAREADEPVGYPAGRRQRDEIEASWCFKSPKVKLILVRLPDACLVPLPARRGGEHAGEPGVSRAPRAERRARSARPPRPVPAQGTRRRARGRPAAPPPRSGGPGMRLSATTPVSTQRRGLLTPTAYLSNRVVSSYSPTPRAGSSFHRACFVRCRPWNFLANRPQIDCNAMPKLRMGGGRRYP